MTGWGFMARLVVTISGGLVSGVFSDNPDHFRAVEVVTVDYDIEGTGRATRKVQGPDGKVAEAHTEDVRVERGRFEVIDD